MKIMKVNGVFLVVGLVVLFAMTPLINAGEGGPPAGYSYLPPPYTGNLSLTYIEVEGIGYVTVNGTASRMGQSGCEIEFDGYTIPYAFFSPDKPFEELNAGDIQGVLFDSRYGGIDSPCFPEASYQEVGVGQLKWESSSALSANFVIMVLQ
jgi:hypothetical protein